MVLITKREAVKQVSILSFKIWIKANENDEIKIFKNRFLRNNPYLKKNKQNIETR